MVNDARMLLFAKLLILSMIIAVPMAPPGTYTFLWSPSYGHIIMRVFFLILLTLACITDMTLGLLLAALAISLSVQERYSRL